MYLNNLLDNSVKEASTNNGEDLFPDKAPVGEQHRPGHHQTTAVKNGTKQNTKFAVTFYLKAKEEAQRGYRKQMHKYWTEDVSFWIEEQHLTCQVRSILKPKILSEVAIEALR